jgi:outer membrane protein OmpA-like peptidoglycan-associated protein
VIREAAALIHPGARIVVTGYTDRQGMEQRNAELSADRARRVAAALREQLEANGVNDVSVQAAGAGIDTERFQNDLPEGRALSRGVYIQVEQGGILKR